MTVHPRNVYLDYNSTSPLIPRILKEYTSILTGFGNPSSVHLNGRRSRYLIDDCRNVLSKYLGVKPRNVIFTSGATEANALAIDGLISVGKVSNVFCSGIEHPSVLNNIPKKNHLKVLDNGQIDLKYLEMMLKDTSSPSLVCLMYANNETGVIQPLIETVELVHKHGGLVFSDMVQAIGKVEFDINALNLDILSISAHKFGGPPGIGALILREGIDINPLYYGGGQEGFKRAGTENILGIFGLKIALEEIHKNYNTKNISLLRDKFEKRISELRPDAIIFGNKVERLPNTTCVALEGISSESQVIRLDLEGFAVSAGSACSSGKITPSHVLLSMGVDYELAKCAIRVSIGPETKWTELEDFLNIWSNF